LNYLLILRHFIDRDAINIINYFRVIDQTRIPLSIHFLTLVIKNNVGQGIMYFVVLGQVSRGSFEQFEYCRATPVINGF